MDTQNGAKTGENRCGHAKQCKGKQKQMLARKTLQKRAKTDAGTQNGAKASKNRCGHTKRCKSEQKQMLVRKTMQKRAKTDAGTKNSACNANE